MSALSFSTLRSAASCRAHPVKGPIKRPVPSAKIAGHADVRSIGNDRTPRARNWPKEAFFTYTGGWTGRGSQVSVFMVHGPRISQGSSSSGERWGHASDEG